MSVRLLISYSGGSKWMRFWAKIKHTPRKLLYLVNRHLERSSKSAKMSNFQRQFFMSRIIRIFQRLILIRFNLRPLEVIVVVPDKAGKAVTFSPNWSEIKIKLRSWFQFGFSSPKKYDPKIVTISALSTMGKIENK